MVSFDDKNRLTNIIKGIVVIVLYFFVSLFSTLPLALLGINYYDLSLIIRIIYSVSVELILIAAIIFIFKDEYKKAFKDIKKNHLTYFKGNLKYYLLGVIIMMLSNSLIMVLGGGTSDNETAIRSQFGIAPIYTYISAVFLAPVLEESVFRLSFRNIFKNKLVFIVISGLVFGGLHLTGMLDDSLMPLYLVAYCSCGVAFAYIMAKTNNIFVSMGFHFMHNGILMSMQLFVLLFG